MSTNQEALQAVYSNLSDPLSTGRLLTSNWIFTQTERLKEEEARLEASLKEIESQRAKKRQFEIDYRLELTRSALETTKGTLQYLETLDKLINRNV